MKTRPCPKAKREDQLRAEFQNAAAAEGRSAARVLRDFMEAYVEMQRNAVGAKAKRQHGLERCTAALLLRPKPWEAVGLLLGPQRELEQTVERQHGWG